MESLLLDGNVGVGVQQQDLPLDAVLLEQRRRHAGALIGAGETAVVTRRNRQQEDAAFEHLKLLLDGKVLGTGNEAAWITRLHCGDIVRVFHSDGRVVVVDARGQDQIVVVKISELGVNPAAVAVHVHHSGVEEYVSIALRCIEIAVAQKLQIHDIGQPEIADGAGHERRPAVNEHHVKGGILLLQVFGHGQAGPATADHHHALALRRGKLRGLAQDARQPRRSCGTRSRL